MSKTKCCVPGCVNSSGESKDILHKLPNAAKEKERFNSWVYAVGGDILSLPNDHIFKNRRVCHRHFEEKYWCSGKHLSVIAIPTKYLAEHSVKFISADGVSLPPIRNAVPGTPDGESTSKDKAIGLQRDGRHINVLTAYFNRSKEAFPRKTDMPNLPDGLITRLTRAEQRKLKVPKLSPQ